MLKDIDKEIIKYVETYKFLTAGQCQSIWFSSIHYGYDVARRHLNKMVKMGYLKSFKPEENIYAEKTYFIDSKYSKPTKSMITAMDIYAELNRLGADVIYYKREEEWFNGKYKSDAFTVIRIDKFIFSSCIEVIDTTKLNYVLHRKHFIEKYTEIYNSNEPIQKLIDITNVNKKFYQPSLLIVSENKYDLELQGINIIFLDFTLKKLCRLFI